MAIERLRLKDFQCHEDLRIKLDPKVTAIIGPSDVGKSAIIRGLKWIATNRPLGDGLIRRGCKEAMAYVWDSDGSKVQRIKGTTQNNYHVNDQKLDAVGTDVPSEVSEVLRIDDMNFQGQHESPFWFDLTAGEVAKRINAIVDLSLIDDTMKNLAARHRKANSSVEVLRDQLSEAREDYKALKFVPAMDGDLRELELLSSRLEKHKQRISRLSGMVTKWLQVKDDQTTNRRILRSWEGVVRARDQAATTNERRDALRKLVQSAKHSRTMAKRRVPDITPLSDLKSECEENIELLSRLNDLISAAKRTTKKAQRLRNEAGAIRREIEEGLDGTCPLCGHDLEDAECLM